MIMESLLYHDVPEHEGESLMSLCAWMKTVRGYKFHIVTAICL